jgi:predicted alpha/beta-fold hydrolase
MSIYCISRSFSCASRISVMQGLPRLLSQRLLHSSTSASVKRYSACGGSKSVRMTTSPYSMLNLNIKSPLLQSTQKTHHRLHSHSTIMTFNSSFSAGCRHMSSASKLSTPGFEDIETVPLFHQELPTVKDEKYQDSERPPIVFLHGLLGSHTNFRTIAVRPEISHNRRVILVDMRNHGRSGHHEYMSPLTMAADVGKLLDDLGLDRVSIVGHSMGGRVGMMLALRQPQRVDRVVIADVAPVKYELEFSSWNSIPNIVR